MTSETDEEFVADMEWLHSHDREAALPPEKLSRLFALARRGAAVQWRPISESDPVPRDGTPFAICCEGEPDSIECGWYDPLTVFDYEEAENGLYKKTPRIGYEWSGFNNMHRATHWMPLPPPPAGETSDD